jgi:hypothetical protein
VSAAEDFAQYKLHFIDAIQHDYEGHCQVVGDDSVTRQQQALSGRDCHRPDA